MSMKNIIQDFKYKRIIPFLLGLGCVLITLLPAIMLGSDSYVNVHDQLDGEVLVYIINARNFLANSFEEFMNNMAATSLTPPSYGTLFFYLFLPPFEAYLCNYVFVSLVAFVGMYWLMDELLEKKWLATLVSVLFSQLPFYSVYGLSVMGQPLVAYVCLQLWKNKNNAYKYLITALFGVFSSLVLVGYVDLLLLGALAVFMTLRKHPSAKSAWMHTMVLFVIYVLPNLSLINQILNPSNIVSHKTELVVGATNWITSFKSMFLKGAYHAEALHGSLVHWAIFLTLIGFCVYGYWSKEEKIKLWSMGMLVMAAAAIAAFYALWHCTPITALRNQLGGLFISFQIDRVYWLYPVIWFMILGLMLWLILQLSNRSKIQKIVSWFCLCMIIGNLGRDIYNSSVFKYNMGILTNTQGSMSWNAFYSPELFQEIEDYINLPQKDYRVASVALYPSVALYNGFYCIDGYSNNYDVEYKHQFRTIIEKELEKSNELKSYYDDWGNRCYIFSSELGKNYYFSKNSTQVLQNLELSSDGLKELECDYIFSGLQIVDPTVSGLEFMRFFEHEDSPYRIYLYKVV